jgi:hypothetical protein
LQIIKKQRERVLRGGEHTQETPESSSAYPEDSEMDDILVATAARPQDLLMILMTD